MIENTLDAKDIRIAELNQDLQKSHKSAIACTEPMRKFCYERGINSANGCVSQDVLNYALQLEQKVELLGKWEKLGRQVINGAFHRNGNWDELAAIATILIEDVEDEIG